MAAPEQLSVFELDLGTKQGRIPDGKGGFVIELGHADRVVTEFSNPAGQSISQTIEFSPDAKLVRARVRLRAPTLSAGMWLFTVALDDDIAYLRHIEPDGRELVLNDIAVTALDETVPHTLTFTLALIGGG